MTKFSEITAYVRVNVEIALPADIDFSDKEVLDDVTNCGFYSENERDVYNHAVMQLLTGGINSQQDVFGWILEEGHPKIKTLPRNSKTIFRNLEIDIDW